MLNNQYCKYLNSVAIYTQLHCKKSNATTLHQNLLILQLKIKTSIITKASNNVPYWLIKVEGRRCFVVGYYIVLHKTFKNIIMRGRKIVQSMLLTEVVI
jgi:hypothetical protein